MVGVKYIASVSFGKDSLAMLLRLLEEEKPLDLVVFYNTGMEFDAIYNIRDKVKPILSDRDIDFVELHPEEPFLYSMFERKIKYRNREGYHYGFGWCGGACRWGTSAKLKAIKEFKKSFHDDIVDYVGIAADEPQRFEKSKREDKAMPLVEWNMTEKDCLEYCHSKGYRWAEHSVDGDVDLYDILDRVSCWCCTNKNLKELRNIHWKLPQYWERLRNLQSRIARPIKQSGSVFDLERRFLLEKEFLDSGKPINTREFHDKIKDVLSAKEDAQ